MEWILHYLMAEIVAVSSGKRRTDSILAIISKYYYYIYRIG